MTEPLPSNELPDTCTFVTYMENELAKSFDKDHPECTQSIKACVFHIVLKAIALSKDPRSDRRAAMALYEAASEIVVNSNLDDDENTQNRLQDLINAIIDGDDLSVQLRLNSINNKQWMEKQNVYFDNKISFLMQELNPIKDSIKVLEKSLVGPKNKRNFKNIVLSVVAGLLTMTAIIILSVVLISGILLTSVSNEVKMEKSRTQTEDIVKEMPK